MSVEQYYKSRYPQDYDLPFLESEKDINRKCWEIMKSLADAGKLSGVTRTSGSSMSETWHFSNPVTGGELGVTLSSGVFGNKIDSNVSVIGWYIRHSIHTESYSMEHSVLSFKLQNAPCRSIGIGALYQILLGKIQ